MCEAATVMCSWKRVPGFARTGTQHTHTQRAADVTREWERQQQPGICVTIALPATAAAAAVAVADRKFVH